VLFDRQRRLQTWRTVRVLSLAQPRGSPQNNCNSQQFPLISSHIPQRSHRKSTGGPTGKRRWRGPGYFQPFNLAARWRRRARETSADARSTELPHSPATSTAGRTAAYRRAAGLARPTRRVRRTFRDRPPCRRTRSMPAVRSRAICSKRDAASAKSARRRSPDPGVVRYAAFVRPMRASSTANCSFGAYDRDVNPAACSRRQKSFRGFAKCAPAAADTRPGLMPQKITRSPGASTSGTALRGAVLRRRPKGRVGSARAAVQRRSLVKQPSAQHDENA